MRLPTHILGLTIAAILLLIAVPYGLVQLDLMRAAHLRVIPSAIATILAVAFVATVLAARRKRRRRP